MKHASNIIALTITAAAVKVYIWVAIVWSKSLEEYKNFQAITKQGFPANAAPQHP